MTNQFQGWSTDLQAFFTELAENNTKEFFEANRDRYLHSVREPAEALLAVLAPSYGKGRIFRINRDVRFTADKHPYHTNLGIEFSGAGVHHYLSVTADQMFASVGVFRPPGGWVERFRQAVAGSAGDELAKVVAHLESGSAKISGEELKRIPHGYPADHPNAGLLRFKGITADQEWPASAWLNNPRVLSTITGFYDQAEPLAQWLSTHCPVGD